MVEGTQGLPLEIRLSAYLDGQLPDTEVSEIEAIIARDEKVRTLFERLKAGSEFGRQAFEEMLHEPVPLTLVRGIRQAPDNDDTPASSFAAITPKGGAGSRSWYRAGSLAASLLLLIVGGAIGYISAGSRTAEAPLQVAADRTWLDEIADYHRIYSRQNRHLVEVPASEAAHITTWLRDAVGVNFTLPDLSDEKLTFEGARLLVAAGKPTAQLIYRGEDGDVFAICFLKSDPGATPSGLTDSMRNDIGLVSWQKGDASYVVVGPSSDPALEKLAEQVAATI